ncbi:MAG: ABC transporter permease [Egibacteraceae bacterium]
MPALALARSVGRFVAGMALVVFTLSTATFLLVHVAPGDAAQTAAAARAGGAADADLIEQLRRQLGLDNPLVAQYWSWLSGAVHGEFGVSARTGREVASELGVRLPVTLRLGAAGAALGVLAGTATGIAGALLRPGTRRGALRLGGLLGASIPNFWLAYLLILVLVEQLGLVPTSGQSGLASWVMPLTVLAVPTAGVLSRMVATTLREALDEPYVVAARARGSTPFAIVVRDALPNAAGAILNTAGVLVGGLLVGTLVAEEIFAWPGIGSYFVDAVGFRDIPAIQACVLVFGLVFVTVNRVVDLGHRHLDPRLRHPVTT